MVKERTPGLDRSQAETEWRSEGIAQLRLVWFVLRACHNYLGVTLQGIHSRNTAETEGCMRTEGIYMQSEGIHAY